MSTKKFCLKAEDIKMRKKDFIFSEDYKNKLSEAKLGDKNPNFGKKHSVIARKKMSEAKTGKKRENFYGVANPRWKGGITEEYLRIRTGFEYELWRRAVMTRDGYTCQKYGTKGGILHAHHIQNFAQWPELRFAIDNGVTLSDKAHREFHKKYGKVNNTKEQLDEFLTC